jgi:hypothetical protein
VVNLEALVTRWRAQAGDLRRFGAGGQADAVDQCAVELESALASMGDEMLSLESAARESGYSADHLGRLIRTGRLTNHGRPKAPKVRHGELPKKPIPLARSAPVGDMEALTLTIIASTRRRAS